VEQKLIIFPILVALLLSGEMRWGLGCMGIGSVLTFRGSRAKQKVGDLCALYFRLCRGHMLPQD
jgi:hypothetical protein